jgi:spermidine/putrescine transport system ATP-binding protein
MTDSLAAPDLNAAGGAAPATPAVRLLELRRTYGDVHAVDGIDLEIGDGEFFSLIGPSGCGKTTTLRMIAGLVEPTAGRIEVHGRDVTDLRPHRRPVNTVFQQYALFPHLSVFENIAFGLRERRTPAQELTRRVDEMVELVGLRGRERHRPSQLSGGQQQRVALARSLVLQPEVLLLDEPLGALDLKLRKALQLELKRIQHEVGITFVYVTHDQEEAFFMSDRVAIMHEGRIEQLGSPREVYKRPATEFVADFVGASNRLDATIVADADGGDGGYDVEIAEVGRLRAGGVPGMTPGQRARAIVRPESVAVVPASPAAAESIGPLAGGEVALPVRIGDVAYLGHHVSYVAHTAAGRQLAVSIRDHAGELSVGEECRLVWPAAAVWLVPAAAQGELATEEHDDA